MRGIEVGLTRVATNDQTRYVAGVVWDMLGNYYVQ